MLYYLSLLEDHVSVFRLFQYITVRTLGAAVTSFCIVLFIPLILSSSTECKRGRARRTCNTGG